jgi:pimeloyl-ACP methyl ester carboxylesterase
MTTLSANGIDLHFEMRGEGEPLLLLHGFMGTSGDWAHVFDVDAFARSRRVIAPDARGHGRSTNPSGAFSFRECARDALAILDQLGIDRFRAVGVSLGAKTLLHVATQQPERVEAMVIVSATPYFPQQAREVMRAAAVTDHPADEWAQMRSRHLGGDDQIRALWRLPERFAATHDDMSFTPPLLSTITARTLVVSGDRDPFYPVELAVEMYRAIPRSELWIVPREGHGPIYGAWREAFASAALAFLDAG